MANTLPARAGERRITTRGGQLYLLSECDPAPVEHGARPRLEFFLGVHRPQWLALSSRPLFVSHRTLRSYKRLPRAVVPWALDSGGFTELNLYGAWRTTPAEYAAAVQRYVDEVGGLVMASQQDWMCEPSVLKKTRLSVREHQVRTIDNYAELMELEPGLPWMPVLQGWCPGDYLDHLEMWHQRGFDLGRLTRVGVGSICRRSSTMSVQRIISYVSECGISIHAFGVKMSGLRQIGCQIASADSMAWSFAARQANRDPGWQLAERKTGRQNELGAALEWYDERVTPLLHEVEGRRSARLQAARAA